MSRHPQPTKPTIYCDYNATAPLRPGVLDAMLPWLGAAAANASSGHASGRLAADSVSDARSNLAALIRARASEIIFTSGATEASNIALSAAVHAFPSAVLVTSATEHPAVLEFVRASSSSVRTRIIPVDRRGVVSMEALAALLSENPGAIVSIMVANNETGVINDIGAIGAIVHSYGGIFHTDATQAVGRIAIDVEQMQIDLLSLSGHKFGGPQGVGAMYVSRALRLPIEPLFHGGGQEGGWRSGTLNVPGIAGVGAAAATAGQLLASEVPAVARLRDRFEQELLNAIPTVSVNGREAPRLPGTSSIVFPGVPADALLAAMPTVAASEGSACASGALGPSHVLLAMKLSRDAADSTVRFSFGYATTEEEVDELIPTVADAYEAVWRAVRTERLAVGAADV